MSGGRSLVTKRMAIGCSHRIGRREEFREPRLLAGNITCVLQQSPQASLIRMIIRDSAGTTYGIVWRRFLDRVRSHSRRFSRCFDMQSLRRRRATFTRSTANKLRHRASIWKRSSSEKMERKRLRMDLGLEFGLKTGGTCHSFLVT